MDPPPWVLIAMKGRGEEQEEEGGGGVVTVKEEDESDGAAVIYEVIQDSVHCCQRG